MYIKLMMVIYVGLEFIVFRRILIIRRRREKRRIGIRFDYRVICR